jgi:hypothetical protein
MKLIYLRLFFATLFISGSIIFTTKTSAQCPDGSPGGGTAYDTTIRIGSGIVNTNIKFPKFDPSTGMVTCVNLCVTIKGIIDTIAVENYEFASNNFSYSYSRKDTIRGPGISTFLQSNANVTSSVYPLAPNDGSLFQGPDFYSHGPDTILTRLLCVNISDSATIADFYGVGDSVEYNYKVDASLISSLPGSSFQFILSSALVNFHFSYCTCPPVSLPLNINDFNITKLNDTKAELQWTAFDDVFANYHYEVEISRDGKSFSSIASYDKNRLSADPYKMLYTVPNGETGTFYFRVKQVYSNGYVRYSKIKLVTLGSPVTTKFSVFPNPSTGIVGIKFDNTLSGHYNIHIYNAQGQLVMKKDLAVSESSYVQLGTLKSGAYWLRLTDVKNQTSCVNQLLIK